MRNGNAALHRELTAALRAGGTEDPELEASWILEDAHTPEQAREIAQRRAAHEPLQYLLGKWEFYGMPFYVGTGVLIPRADTETLVEAVLARVPDAPGQQITDLCTGSGCIALALAAHMTHTQFTGIDLSAAALEYARRNQTLNGLRNARMCRADVLDAAAASQYHDLAAVVCNPPYLTAAEMQQLQQEVRYEPQEALAGGADGLDFYRRITELWRDSLRNGGLLAYEVGYEQADAVAALLAENSFSDIETVSDYNGIERVVLGRKHGSQKG